MPLTTRVSAFVQPNTTHAQATVLWLDARGGAAPCPLRRGAAAGRHPFFLPRLRISPVERSRSHAGLPVRQGGRPRRGGLARAGFVLLGRFGSALGSARAGNSGSPPESDLIVALLGPDPSGIGLGLRIAER